MYNPLENEWEFKNGTIYIVVPLHNYIMTESLFA